MSDECDISVQNQNILPLIALSYISEYSAFGCDSELCSYYSGINLDSTVCKLPLHNIYYQCCFKMFSFRHKVCLSTAI